MCCAGRVKFQGVHHVGLLCEDLEASLKFYKGLLGEWGSGGIYDSPTLQEKGGS